MEQQAAGPPTLDLCLHHEDLTEEVPPLWSAFSGRVVGSLCLDLLKSLVGILGNHVWLIFMT